MAGLDDHFGEEIEIDTESINAISGYLISNSAEKSSAKRAVKIVRLPERANSDSDLRNPLYYRKAR